MEINHDIGGAGAAQRWVRRSDMADAIQTPSPFQSTLLSIRMLVTT